MPEPILDPKAIGARIRARREELGLVQEDLADAADVRGLAISDIELGKTTNPKTATIAAIARTLKVDVDFILFGARPAEPAPEARVEIELPTTLAAFLRGTRVTEDERSALIDLSKRRSDGAIDYADELQALRVPAAKKVEDRSQADAPRLAPDAPRAAPIKRKPR